MYKIIRDLHFCYGHRLLNYNGPCKNLHGHNGKIEIQLAGEKLDALGLLYDFSEVKRIVKSWIDENLDHKLLLHRADPLAQTLIDAGEDIYLMDENPSAEAIAKLIYEFCAAHGLPIEQVCLWETESARAIYRR